MGLPQPSHPLLLLPLLLLLLVATGPGWPQGLCPLPCRCRGRLLDCSRAALASVPPATHRWALSILDFTGNSISSIEKQTWREYPWAEYLILRDNDLRAVKRRSLEGLLLLKHLDLSRNKILSIEEHAFEPLPFLQLINLGGNRITQIRNGTFQAWHGMQFLQKLILSQNPLSVIDDTSFFKLPSVKYLDFGATQVTQQTLLTLLLTTVSLEKLKLPRDMACCLCQERRTTETPCGTIEFHCKNLCAARAPRCARTDPLAETQGEITEAVQPRKLNASTVLNLKPKEPSLGDQETITFAVVLSLTGTAGDLSNLNDHISRTNSHSPQHLPRQEGKTSEELTLMLHSIRHMGWTSETDIRKLYFLAKALAAELKKRLNMAKSIVTVTNTTSPLPAPAVLKDEVHEIPAVEAKTATGRVEKQRDLGLNQAALKPWEAAGSLNPTGNLSILRHHETPTSPSQHSLSRSPAEASHSSGSFKIQNYSDAVEQTEKTHGMEDEEDVEEAEGAPSPRQDYVWTYGKDKQGDSPSLNKSNQLFYKMFGNVSLEEEPTPTENKAEQRLNTNQHFFYNPLVNSSPPAASGMLGDTAEEESSSLGGHLPAVPRDAETHWKQQKEGSSFLNKPGSSDSPDGTPVPQDLFETKVRRHLRLLVPDKALRTFIAQVVRALRRDCSLPEVQLACAKLVSKTGLLVKRLSERQGDQAASALTGQCLLEGNVSNGMARAREAGGKPTGKWKPEYTSSDRLLLAISVSVIIMINLTVICLVEVCSQKPAAASRPRSTSKSRPRWFFPKFLPWGRRKSKYDVREPGLRILDLGKPEPQWLRHLYQPLESQQETFTAELYDRETSDEEDIFNKFKLNWIPTAPQQSFDRGEMRFPRDPVPLPSRPGAAREPEQRSLPGERDAPGGPALGTPQSSARPAGSGRARRAGEPS